MADIAFTSCFVLICLTLYTLCRTVVGQSTSGALDEGCPTWCDGADKACLVEKLRGEMMSELVELELKTRNSFKEIKQMMSETQPMFGGHQSSKTGGRSSSVTPSPPEYYPATRTPSGEPAIWGVTVMYEELFVIREGIPEVEVYDSTTLEFKRLLPVEGLVRANDMTSSTRYSCLYISDRGATYGVQRVEINGKKTIWPLSDRPSGLSATRDGWNVIVTFPESRKIIEYTTHGDTVRVIRLQEDMATPLHAVQTPSGDFFVCHGYGTDPLHRVCKVNREGQVIKCSPKDSVKYPLRLDVDANAFVFVADVTNRRVLILSPLLSVVGTLPQPGGSVWNPTRIYLDETRGHLYVADNALNETSQNYIAGQIQLFKLKTIFN